MINWTRGLVRLWIAVSLLWVALIAAMGYSMRPQNEVVYYSLEAGAVVLSQFDLSDSERARIRDGNSYTIEKDTVRLIFPTWVFDGRTVLMPSKGNAKGL
jgi:hypothetical protein